MTGLRFVWERELRVAGAAAAGAVALSPPQRFTALMLATFAGPDGGGARPGEVLLAQGVGKCARTVRRHLEALRVSGWVTRVRRGSSFGRAGRADEYRLTIPAQLLAPVTGEAPLTGEENTASPRPEHRRTATGTPDIGDHPPPGDPAEPAGPPRACPAHREQPAAGPCPPCGDYRRAREAWDTEQDRAAVAAAAAGRRAAAQQRAAARAACGRCDGAGYVGTVLCDHDPATPERTARGSAAVRAALGTGGERERRTSKRYQPLPGQRPLIGVIDGEGTGPAPGQAPEPAWQVPEAAAVVASTGRHRLPELPQPVPEPARAVTALLADELARRRGRDPAHARAAPSTTDDQHTQESTG